MALELASVTTDDQKSFQRWPKATRSRYAATRPLRERPPRGSSRRPPPRITSGPVRITVDLWDHVPLSLAALVMNEKDPLPFLSQWVGEHQEVAEDAVAFLDAFTDPDPEFEWMVEEARIELERLGAGR